MRDGVGRHLGAGLAVAVKVVVVVVVVVAVARAAAKRGTGGRRGEVVVVGELASGVAQGAVPAAAQGAERASIAAVARVTVEQCMKQPPSEKCEH